MPQNQYAILTLPLRGFEEPDTTSTIEGKVQPGKYRVIQLQKNHPNVDTDYALIDVPALGDEETWICTRWKNHVYAAITLEEVTAQPPLDFSDDPMAIDESAVVELLPEFHPFTYDLDVARYPFPLTGFKTPLAPPQSNNCCTFVEALIAKAWENATNYQWSKAKHAQMMIFSADDYYSPITALVESQIGVAVHDNDQAPQPWSVVQGWRHQWRGGHTFIILKHHPETDRVLTLESNSAFKLNGPGFRMIGNLRDFPSPPDQWWDRDDLWTWERIKSVYHHRKFCTLKLKNLNWIQ